jgi:cold shock CspA family protein
MATGRIKVWTEKGYGFIQRDDNSGGKRDVFVHIRHCDGFEPIAGQRVAFDVTVDDRNPKGRADNVRLIDDEQAEQHEWLHEHKARHAEQ